MGIIHISKSMKQNILLLWLHMYVWYSQNVYESQIQMLLMYLIQLISQQTNLIMLEKKRPSISLIYIYKSQESCYQYGQSLSQLVFKHEAKLLLKYFLERNIYKQNSLSLNINCLVPKQNLDLASVWDNASSTWWTWQCQAFSHCDNHTALLCLIALNQYRYIYIRVIQSHQIHSIQDIH